MGTYIIHFDDKPWEDLDDELYYRCFEIPWFSTTKTTISRLTPYTEDSTYAHGYTEAESKYREIRDELEKQAYQRGYENGFIAGHLKAEKSGQSFYEDGYQRGMADANRDGEYNADDGWYVMQKISLLPNPIKTELFGTAETAVILQDNSFKDALDKLTEYEQEKDRQARIEYNFDEIKDVLETTAKECNVSLDEIAEVLAKMKEADNG